MSPETSPIRSPSDLAPYIEQTLLKSDASASDVERLCTEARRFGFRAVCVNSRFTPLAARALEGSGVLVVATVGFPLGASLSSAKAEEARLAVRAGADEIDMVIAVGSAKSGDWDDVVEDVRAVVRGAEGRPVKAILETALLTEDEIVRACRAASEAGAAFVKTSTGFSSRGATVDDIALMKSSVGPKMQIKASGSIRTYEGAKALVEAGASRLGTSSGPALIGATADGASGY